MRRNEMLLPLAKQTGFLGQRVLVRVLMNLLNNTDMSSLDLSDIDNFKKRWTREAQTAKNTSICRTRSKRGQGRCLEHSG